MRKVLYILIVIALAVGTTLTLRSSQKAQEASQLAFAEKVAGLETQIEELQGKIEALSGEQEKTVLSLQELKNREVVKQKSQDELLTAAVAKVAPAVVSVVVSKDVPKLEVVYKNPFGDDPFFKNFNIRIPVYQQKGVERKQVGAGTGFLITSDGYLLTNKHVVADTTASYTVLLTDGSQKEAQVVYRDNSHDIAILKIAGGGLSTAATFGNSDALKLGQTVVAIGNALGEYNNSVSVGIISGLGRNIEASGVKLNDVIQTDAAINPGNSGGPLLDLGGRVVGVNVATVVGASSISFAIPINVVKGIIKTAIGK